MAIELFKKYIAGLDEVYKLEAKTVILESPSALARQGANTNEIVIPKISMDGLADHVRSGGGKYVAGNVDLVMETVKFNFDRSRQFAIDAMDNEESAGVAFGMLAGEFVRTKVVPELDAFRFATYASAAGTAVSGTIADGAAFLTALITAKGVMDDAEVPETERYLFATSTLYNAVMGLDTTKSREVLDTFASIVTVPQVRFYTAIDQKDGVTSGEEAGGYAKATAGKDINFMIVHKPALLQFTKHLVTKIIPPEMNNDGDGWLFNYRAYGLADVYENKVKGVYLHHKA